MGRVSLSFLGGGGLGLPVGGAFGLDKTLTLSMDEDFSSISFDGGVSVAVDKVVDSFLGGGGLGRLVGGALGLSVTGTTSSLLDSVLGGCGLDLEGGGFGLDEICSLSFSLSKVGGAFSSVGGAFSSTSTSSFEGGVSVVVDEVLGSFLGGGGLGRPVGGALGLPVTGAVLFSALGGCGLDLVGGGFGLDETSLLFASSTVGGAFSSAFSLISTSSFLASSFGGCGLDLGGGGFDLLEDKLALDNSSPMLSLDGRGLGGEFFSSGLALGRGDFGDMLGGGSLPAAPLVLDLGGGGLGRPGAGLAGVRDLTGTS